MAAVQDFVGAVDRFIEKPKRLMTAAPTTWQRAVRDADEMRLKIPLESDGVQSGEYLVLKAYPEYSLQPRFSISLMFLELVVCRLDFELDAIHGNNSPTARHRLPLVVRGPHWHSWELNRMTVKSVTHYLPLPNADEFTHARKFDATLRWYCDKRRIALDEHGIELPHRTRLL